MRFLWDITRSDGRDFPARNYEGSFGVIPQENPPVAELEKMLTKGLIDNECMCHEYSALQRQLEQLADENVALRQSLEDAREQLRTTEARLSALLAERTRARTDTATMDSFAHSEIAQEFRSLADQDLYHLARLNSSARGCSPTHVPHTIASLCRALFGPHPVSEHRVRDELRYGSPVPDDRIDRICAQARRLRKRATDTGREHRWEFAIRNGAALDSNRQQAWSTCDPDQPVQFLVTPGYIVENRVYGLQQVFTAPAR
jgi:hypothetical protein